MNHNIVFYFSIAIIILLFIITMILVYYNNQIKDIQQFFQLEIEKTQKDITNESKNS